MRKRLITPTFFFNEDLGELNVEARLLFIGLWTLADKEGRLQDRPKQIRAQILPYDDVNADQLLNNLQHAGFILRYEIDQKRYIQVQNWKKHQNPHHKEVESIIPAPKTSKNQEVAQAWPKHGSSMTTKVVKHSSSLPADTDTDTNTNADTDISIEAEQSSASDEVVIGLPTNRFKTKSETYDVLNEALMNFKETYPAVDVLAELKKMKTWLESNPTRRKTKNGMPRFINSWLTRQQDRPMVRNASAAGDQWLQMEDN